MSRPVRRPIHSRPVGATVPAGRSAQRGVLPTVTHSVPHAVRIIAGRWRRSRLVVPEGLGLRPTPDRVRETLFNWLAALHGDLAGMHVLDAFAGSGALGFEAASRGAEKVLLIDNQPVAAAALRGACERLGAEMVTVLQADTTQALQNLQQHSARFDLIFLDPPYGLGWIGRILPKLPALANAGAWIYVEAEHALADLLPDGELPAEFELMRADKAGQVFYHLLRCKNR